MPRKEQISIPTEIIENKIYLIRGQKVMLSITLADLYEVEHRTLMQAVQRNKERFPEDFMFQLTKAEFVNLKSQFVISSWEVLEKCPMPLRSRELRCFRAC